MMLLHADTNDVVTADVVITEVDLSVVDIALGITHVDRAFGSAVFDIADVDTDSLRDYAESMYLKTH